MTTVLVRRPAPSDLAGPGTAAEPLVVAAPPQQHEPQAGSTNLAMIVMPVVSGSGSLLITLTNRDRPLFAAAGLMFMVVSVGLGVVLFIGTRSSARRRQRTDRERYLDYLEGMRRTSREAAALQRVRSAARHPDPELLLDIARLPARRWERRRTDPDFLRVRIGSGTTPLVRGLTVALDRTNPLVTYDPVCLSAAESLVDRYASLSEEPITVPLGEIGYLSVVGDRPRGRALARAIIGQLVALHPPDDLTIAVVRAPCLQAEWEWVKWLPHAADQLLLAPSPQELVSRMAADLDHRKADAERRLGRQPGRGLRRLVVIVDGEFQHTAASLDIGSSESPADLGIHLICLVAHRREEPEQVDLRTVLHVQPTSTRGEQADACVSATVEGELVLGDAEAVHVVDDLQLSCASGLARSLSPLRLAEDDDSDALSATVGLRELLGVTDVALLDPQHSWRPGSARDFLRVPLGVGSGGQPVYLDLKESAQDGMGPHGLVVGATGSGKSEMLRTMVTSLVIGHSPDRLALLLVDFKGGATFSGFAELPHVAGMVTNLAADPGLVQRFRDALLGELTRRQRMLADAGNLPNCQAYADLVERSQSQPDLRPGRGRSDSGSDLEPMPHLLVIIDEFTELLAARPDFAELFLAVGRIGRSIGVHLLLATQRLDAGRIRGLESHLSYRISLRTFSESESREALGVPDAYHLPPAPGAGYLKVDTTVFERFKAALVSTPYERPLTEVRSFAPVMPFSTVTDPVTAMTTALDTTALAPAGTGSRPQPLSAAPTILDVAVARLVRAGAERVRQVWIQPLPSILALDSVPGGEAFGDEAAVALHRSPAVCAVLGLQDIPAEQRQIPLIWDFTGPQGNVLVLGAALSGKSVLLRTMVCSLALRYPPGEVALYCVDYGGGSLAGLEDLPHVAGACTRSDPDRVRRSVADVFSMLDAREALLSQYGWDGADGIRRARRHGELPAEVLGDVFLVIDGWAALREAEPNLEDQVMAIANRGPSLGVHTILAASTAAQVRARLATALPGRIELRLSDAFDSTIDRRLAESVPADVPGRALVPGGHLAQVALPRLDGGSTLEDLPAAVQSLVAEVRRRWPGPGVGRVRVLPSLLTLSELPLFAGPVKSSNRGDRAVLVGVTERDLSPVAVDLFGADPHLQVYGESQSGKSAFLRTLMTQLVGACPPQALGVVLVDYRRAHLDLVPAQHLLAYCTSATATRQAVGQVCQGLAQRMPGPEVNSDQLRARNWWSGREILVVVDDYDLVTGSAGNPLTPLTEYLPQGRDLGLHLVTARRTGGASRAMFESVTQALTDLAGPGLLFSGDRTEGRLVAGVSSLRLPPGRALLARRGVPPEQVQIAWSEAV